MTRSRRLLLAGLLAGLAVWWAGDRLLGEPTAPIDPAAGEPSSRPMSPLARAIAEARERNGATPWQLPARIGGGVTISGTVIDVRTRAGVGGVEVVFRSAAGEATTTAAGDGRYQITVPAGTYRAFVRDDTVLSIGRPDHVRLPGPPSAESASAPDESLMPVVTAGGDIDDLDLTVTRGGVLRGKVIGPAGQPLAGAVLRARSPGLRPALGTDVAETASDGAFELRLPAGVYYLDATHPRYAGLVDEREARLVIEPGDVATRTVKLTAGCVIEGRVVAAGGHAAGDGAIERRWGASDLQFAPAGRIAPDGTFRWTTTEAGDVVLRAWPWKAPPSPAQTFACKDGARHQGVVFTLPDRGPDVDGVLVDAAGQPVAMAFIDLEPLDEGGSGQQERTDGQGRWSVYQLPAGRYRAMAHAPGRGVVAMQITAPQTQVRLQLGGTGRIEGAAPNLAKGSFELTLGACFDSEGPMRLPAERRLVTVTAGRFVVDDVPACDLQYVASWRGQSRPGRIEVTAGGAAQLELDLGPPRAVAVHGTVTDGGRPVAGATLIATFHDQPPATATTDATGRFTINTFAGARLAATKPGSGGTTRHGFARVDDGDPAETGGQEIDIALTVTSSGDIDEIEGPSGPGGPDAVDEPEVPDSDSDSIDEPELIDE